MDDHIRIGDIAPRVQYQADGVQTGFTYPFPVFSAADIEVRLDGVPRAGGFVVTNAGASEGGTVVFDQPPRAGTRITLRRAMVVARTTDFQSNGILRARTLNDELDYQVAILQEVKDGLGNALHLDPSESGPTALPLRGARANRLLGFDSLGNIITFGRDEGLLTTGFPGGVPRTVEDKLAERLTARDFGATGDGMTDDGPALQMAMTAAGASGKLLEIGEGTFRTGQALTLPGAAAGLLMRGTILYAGPAGQAALTLGDGGAANNQGKLYTGLAVLRATQSDWSSEGDVGIRIRNIDACLVDIRRAERFTIGVQVVGDARGSEDSDLRYGRLVDNRIGLDLRTLTASGWVNSLRHQGGHFACSSATNPALPRFGVRLSAAPGAYVLHNTHLFTGPAFELQRQGTPGAVDAIPFLIEVDGRGLTATGVRMEACSPYVARHTGGFSDARYEVAYVGTYGFLGCAVQYQGASRAGGTVVPMHQAAAAIGTPRLVAAAENVRTLAFRQGISVADGIGFDQLAVLSGNPSGPPSTLNGFCFPGLNLLTLNPDDVTIPTSRALAFVVDCSQCKEFFIAAEGSGLRPMVMQFDGAETVLGAGSPVLFSNMNAVMQGAPSYWWEGNADLDSLTGGLALNRLQRVTLSADAQYAAIGIRGSSAGAVLRALRLYTSALHAPRLLYGGSRAWGRREYTVSDGGWTIPALAAGATATYDVTLPGVRQGDFVRVGFAQASGFQNGGVVFHASVGGTAGSNQVRVTAQNVSGGAITLGAGTLYVRATKPRL
ncbi:phage tail fiber domain-containing protein [Belnapia rosea]|uniref:phage tail fiber domain-containing protein n=1 Tax=Belnapia rosea TaxID=938405 RepID=UPI0008858618|nr:phage tail fiber protein [Belnapia rosea]SDB72102.1 Pectate lyase superfamily protein [Belnapia rosea]